MDRRTFVKYGIVGTGCFAFLETLQAASKTKRPNIVYILTDQWRAQATGYAGDPNVKTPNLDRLAKESVNFQNAVTVCPVCTPYRAALLSGKYPTSTGMFMNDLYLPEETLCMAEIFNSSDYDTAYIGKWHLDGHGRHAYIPPERRQGFSYWKAEECDHNYNNSHYYEGNSADKKHWQGYAPFEQTKDAQKYIKEHSAKENPFLLMLSYATPHFPHETAPKKYRDMYPEESIQLRPNVPESTMDRAKKEAIGYYAHCTALDKCVGDILNTIETAGIADETIVVFTSDHGEMLGSQGVEPLQKQSPWDESIRVPFLLRFPKAHGKQGKTLNLPINTPDILPTLLALSDISIPEEIEGEDFSQLIRHEDFTNKADHAALFMIVKPFAGYHGGKEFRGIRTSRYTYVRDITGPWLLYDNQNDPHQMNNLIGTKGHELLQAKLNDLLNAKLRSIGDDFKPGDDYIEKYGYHVDERDAIPYPKNSPVKVQSPSK